MYNDSLFNAFARSFEARRETDMPIAEYLESCRGDPMRYANAAERILAAIGEPQMILVVDEDAVRVIEYALAPRIQKFAFLVEHDHGIRAAIV